jgi:hypothetical protein
MAKLILLLSILTVFSVGCNKPNPNPELLDPVYLDIEKDRKAFEANIVSIKEEVEGHKKNLNAVEPHTGQIHYARKRLYEAEMILQRNIQQEKYLRVRLQSRKDEVFLKYMKAFKDKAPWPDPKEYADYLSLKSMRAAPPQWRPRERLEKYKAELAGPRKPATEDKQE